MRLRVSPGATRSGVVGRHGDSWKLRVAAAPERGLANDALVALLSDALRLPRRDIELVTGETARDKVVVLRGLTAEEADRRLAAASGGAS